MWFDQVAKRDVQKAIVNGFSQDCFIKGRGKVYELCCYDEKGDLGSYRTIGQPNKCELEDQKDGLAPQSFLCKNKSLKRLPNIYASSSS